MIRVFFQHASNRKLLMLGDVKPDDWEVPTGVDSLGVEYFFARSGPGWVLYRERTFSKGQKTA